MGSGVNNIGFRRSYTMTNIQESQENKVDRTNLENGAKVLKDDTDIKKYVCSKLLRNESPLVRPDEYFAENHKVSRLDDEPQPDDTDSSDIESEESDRLKLYLDDGSVLSDIESEESDRLKLYAEHVGVDIEDQQAKPEKPKINLDDWTVLTKKNLELNFEDIDKMTHGKYNLGQLKLDANGNLTRINNHKFRFLRNFSSTTPDENIAVRKAVGDALREKFSAIAFGPKGRKILNAIIGKEEINKPLSRKTVGAVINELTQVSLYEEFSQHVGNPEVRKLIESVNDGNWASQAQDRQNFVGGIESKIKELIKTTKFVLPNEKLSQLVQLANIPSLKGEYVRLIGDDGGISNTPPKACENAAIRHAVVAWLTEMRKQSANFDVQEDFYGLPSDPLLRAVRTILLDPSNIEKELRLDDVCGLIEKLQPTVDGDEPVSEEDLAFAKEVLAGESRSLIDWIKEEGGDDVEEEDELKADYKELTKKTASIVEYSKAMIEWFDAIGMDESKDQTFCDAIQDAINMNGGGAFHAKKVEERQGILFKALDDFVEANFKSSVREHKKYKDARTAKLWNAMSLELVGNGRFGEHMLIANRVRLMRKIAKEGKGFMSNRYIEATGRNGALERELGGEVPQEKYILAPWYVLARWKMRQRIGAELLERAGMNKTSQPIKEGLGEDTDLKQLKDQVSDLEKKIALNTNWLADVEDRLRQEESKLKLLQTRRETDLKKKSLDQAEKEFLPSWLAEANKALTELQGLLGDVNGDGKFDLKQKIDSISKKNPLVSDVLDGILRELLEKNKPHKQDEMRDKKMLEVLINKFMWRRSRRQADLDKLSNGNNELLALEEVVKRDRKLAMTIRTNDKQFKNELLSMQIRIESIEMSREASLVDDCMKRLEKTLKPRSRTRKRA